MTDYGLGHISGATVMVRVGAYRRPKTPDKAPGQASKSISLDNKTKSHIERVVRRLYPNLNIGQCVIINETVAKLLRDRLEDPLNNTGKVYIVQGKVELDMEIVDYCGGDPDQPFETHQPDHVYLLVFPRGSKRSIWDLHQDWVDGTSGGELWDFAEGVFGDARIVEILPMDDELRGTEFDPVLYAELKKELSHMDVSRFSLVHRRPEVHVRSHRRRR